MNRAIGDTGSYLGVYRNARDIILSKPDLLFIEYAINDRYNGCLYENAKSQFETIVREVKTALPTCDIVTVLVTDELVLREAAQGQLHPEAKAHEDIARAYGLPSIKVGLYLASSFNPEADDKAKELFWEQFSSDIVHLNNTGNAKYFEVICRFLENTLVPNDTHSFGKDSQVHLADVPIQSYSLLDGDRTTITATEKTAVAKSTAISLNHIVDGDTNFSTMFAPNNPDGNVLVGFKVDEKKVTTFGGIDYVGELSLSGVKEGSFTFTYFGTDCGFYYAGGAQAAFTYTAEGKNAGRTFTGQGEMGDGARSTVTIMAGCPEDFYRVTVSFSYRGTQTIGIQALTYRNANKQTVRNETDNVTTTATGALPVTSTVKKTTDTSQTGTNASTVQSQASSTVSGDIISEVETATTTVTKEPSSSSSGKNTVVSFLVAVVTFLAVCVGGFFVVRKSKPNKKE